MLCALKGVLGVKAVKSSDTGAVRQGHQCERCSEYLCTFHLDFLAFGTLRTFKAEVGHASGKSVALNCSINFDIPPSVKIVR